jgi:hypothetical protein
VPITRIRLLVSMAYGLAILVAVFFFDGVVAPVAAIGAVLVGITYIALRPAPGEGRQRDRRRSRG